MNCTITTAGCSATDSNMDSPYTLRPLQIVKRAFFGSWPVWPGTWYYQVKAGIIMNLENTQVQMRKGILEFCVLQIISRGEVYASDLMDELTNARIIVVEGTLYPLLARLKNAGLLEHKWVESPYGPPRKYYRLTDKGVKFLSALTSTWEELVRSTELILSRSKKPA